MSSSSQHSLSLGPLVLLARQSGPLVDVSITANGLAVGEMQIALPTWTGLVCLVDVLAAADRRHAEDRQALERLVKALRGCEAVRDTAVRCYDQLGEELERVVGGDGTSMERLRALVAERDDLRTAFELASRSRDRNYEKRLAAEAERDAIRAECHGRRFDPNMQPVFSVLRDWDWGGIAEDGCFRSDYERAIEAVVKAMAEVERSVGKEKP